MTEKIKSIACVGIFLLFSLVSNAQAILGTWKTIDDKSGNPVSYVKITEQDGKFYGIIVKLLPAATVTHCNECEGEAKGAPIEGLQILWDLQPYKDYWSYGTIMDPKNGNKYKCSVWMEGDDVLKVRGYIGISLLGRTQKWYRVKE